MLTLPDSTALTFAGNFYQLIIPNLLHFLVSDDCLSFDDELVILCIACNECYLPQVEVCHYFLFGDAPTAATV